MTDPTRPRPVPGPPRPGPVPARPAAAGGPAAPSAEEAAPSAEEAAPRARPWADLSGRPVAEHVAVFEAEHARLQRELGTIDQL
jgi:hypothetical protein